MIWIIMDVHMSHLTFLFCIVNVQRRATHSLACVALGDIAFIRSTCGVERCDKSNQKCQLIATFDSDNTRKYSVQQT